MTEQKTERYPADVNGDGTVDDEEKRMAKIFDIYELILIRPDRYVYGGIKSMQETSNIIEELEKTFSLKI